MLHGSETRRRMSAQKETERPRLQPHQTLPPMIDFPFKISSVLTYSVTLTIFVLAFISARYFLQVMRKKSRKGY